MDNWWYQMYSKQSLQMLDTIARLGSFTAAAEQLHKVPSAISYAVRQVENELGVKIFNRLARKVELTEAGQHFINEARQLLRHMEEVKAQTKRVENGYHKTVKLTLDNIVKLEQLKPLIEDFYRTFDFAELQINMEVFNGSWEAISEGRADIVIGATSAIPVSGDYGVKSMGEIDWAYVMAVDHPLSNKSELTADDLMNIPAICLDDTSTLLPKRHTWHSMQQRRLLLPNWFSAIECLKNKVGMGYMPRHMAKHFIAQGELIEAQISGDKPLSACCLVWRKDEGNKLVEWLIDYLGDSEQLHKQWLE